MSTWNSRGLRGSTLEDMINRTNERYLESGLALNVIQFFMAVLPDQFIKNGLKT